MANLRCMVVLQNKSGLSEDRVVNTLHFAADSRDEADVSPIATKLTQIFNDPLPDKTDYTLSRCLSPVLDRGNNRSEFRFYDLADPEPREPTIIQWTLGPSLDARGLPSEVALCLSYYSERNVKRRRGRLYLGPLSDSIAGTEDTDVRPAITIVGGIVRQWATLLPSAGPQPWAWGLWSIADAAPDHSEPSVMRAPTHLWMDNAFDTQRRRGVAATLRYMQPQ